MVFTGFYYTLIFMGGKGAGSPILTWAMHRQWRSRAELHTTATFGNQPPLFKIGRSYCRKHRPHDRPPDNTLLSINKQFPEELTKSTFRV